MVSGNTGVPQEEPGGLAGAAAPLPSSATLRHLVTSCWPSPSCSERAASSPPSRLPASALGLGLHSGPAGLRPVCPRPEHPAVHVAKRGGRTRGMCSCLAAHRGPLSAVCVGSGQGRGLQPRRWVWWEVVGSGWGLRPALWPSAVPHGAREVPMVSTRGSEHMQWAEVESPQCQKSQRHCHPATGPSLQGAARLWPLGS